MRFSKRTGGIAAAAVALLMLIGALAFGPIVRSKMKTRAEQRGLVLQAGSVSPGWFAATVHDVHVTLEGTDAVAIDLPEIRVELSFWFRPESVTSHSGHVALHGTEDELAGAIRAWRDRHPPAESNASTTKLMAIAFDGMAIDWDDRASATGISLSRDEAGTHAAIEQAKAKYGQFSLDFGSTRIGVGERGALHDVTIATADVTWTSEAAATTKRTELANASSTNEPAPPPLPVALPSKKKGAAPTKTPVALETPPIALPDLRAIHDRFERAMHALAERLGDDAQVEVQSISVHHVVTGSDKPQLTLGPAKLTVRRHEAQIDVSFTTQENAAGARLALDASVPIEKGDARVAFSGGPITLAELGAKEGAGGLADVASATVTAKGSAVFKADASAVTIDADVGVSHLGLSHPKLADDVVHGLDASLVLRASYDDHGVLSVEDAEGTVGALHAQFRGSIVDARDHVEGALTFDAPTAACQSLLSSIPEALVPDVRDMELSGTFGLEGKLAFDTRDLDELELAYKTDDKCKFDHVTDDFSRERFTHPFQHTVYLPDGSTAQEESGPGSDAWIDLDRVSPYMQIAVLTTEDGAFFKHAGFNHAAIRTSIIANLKAGRFVRGASTISMQLAKNLFLSREKTVSRKLEEVILTDYLEQTFTKHEIMELYLNVIEFGPDVYGIAAAAEHYFGRKPDELNLAECLFLSSLLPNPIGYHRLYEKGQISASWSRNIKTLMEIAFKSGKISQDELTQGEAEEVVFFKDDDPDHPKPRPTPRPPVSGVRVVGDDEPFKPID